REPGLTLYARPALSDATSALSRGRDGFGRAAATSAGRRPDALGEASDPLVELRGRERAEGQAEEPLTASVREEGEAVGEVQPPRRRCCAHRRGGRSGREREGDEEAAVGTSRVGVGHHPVERSETGVEPRRIERL